MTSTPLNGKVIVVVGGTTGLGLSGAVACIDAGARVVVVGRNPDHAAAAVAQLGGNSRSIIGDATDSDTARRAVQRAVDEFGRLDGLYHVAGGSGRRRGDGPLHTITDDGWDYTLRLNLTSVFHSNRAAIGQFLVQRSPGAILNMGSVLGFSPSPRYFSTHAYAAAKAAIEGLSRSAAAYYAPHDIRINVVTPALVETPMSERAVGDEAVMRYIAAKQPLDGPNDVPLHGGGVNRTGRVGRPSDLDAAVVYFLSDQSRFVTGQTLAVDGGWSVTEGQVE
jgi:NAD(P)-dependent dehydrogenase (short-subunit alcohol dehydrogenase family)